MRKTVYVISFSHIDFCHPIDDPEELDELSNLSGLLPCSLTNAGRAFIEAGWEGDGEIAALWIPPFMFDADDTVGLHIWHVKQSNNGTSWLCADRPHDFPGLRGGHERWKSVEIVEPN